MLKIPTFARIAWNTFDQKDLWRDDQESIFWATLKIKMKKLKIRNSVFTQKNINSELLSTLLGIESKLYDLNEGEKLVKIAVFTTEEVPFSLAADTLTDDDFMELVAFFKDIDFLNEMEMESTMEQDDKLEPFQDFILGGKTIGDVASSMKSYAFGSSFFSDFDFREKEGERAFDYIASHGSLPIYEIADIEKRNQCIETICANIMSDLNMMADTEMYQYFMTDSLTSPSNSEFAIPFWVMPNAIIMFKSYIRP